MEKDESDYWFNEGRLSADQKWMRAIDERVKELERLVGIPELKRLKQIKYTWNLKEEREKLIQKITQAPRKSKRKIVKGKHSFMIKGAIKKRRESDNSG